MKDGFFFTIRMSTVSLLVTLERNLKNENEKIAKIESDKH